MFSRRSRMVERVCGRITESGLELLVWEAAMRRYEALRSTISNL
jgi:hypothetical protein